MESKSGRETFPQIFRKSMAPAKLRPHRYEDQFRTEMKLLRLVLQYGKGFRNTVKFERKLLGGVSVQILLWCASD